MAAVETNVHFREHDVEFLQKRTKLWLETVLGEKYGDLTLAELIADGNLLYRVSKYITREITGASPGPQDMSPKTFSDVAIYGKHSGKYLPYANVDTFLKICRKVGLTDVELFTPPDAVEGKDIRRVCTSIRSLARKARGQHIRVPDFEDVNRPLPMPKEKVGEIKENLQHSNNTQVTPMVATPEADIQKSERVQIISNFLSATTKPSSLGPASTPPSTGSSPVTPGLVKSLSYNSLREDPTFWSPPTPDATIEGISTPSFTKSSSVLDPSTRHMDSKSNFALTPKSLPADQPKPEKTPVRSALSSTQSVDQSNESSVSYSQRGLGSYRHAQPHFIKKSSSQSNLSSSAGDLPDEVEPPKPMPEKTPSTVAVSFDQPANHSKESPSYSQLGLGSYKHAQPHFVLKKSSQHDLPESSPHCEAIETQFIKALPEPEVVVPPNGETPKAPSVKSKALSSNKIVEERPRSMKLPTEPVKVPSRATQISKAHAMPAKEPVKKPQDRAPDTGLNLKVWLPVVAGALAFVGTLLLVRTRDPVVYEVKEGDTLTKISKRVGRDSWDELVKLNPSITNPNLIYPSERLKLPT